MHARKLLASPTFAAIDFENPVSTYSHKSTSFTVDVKSARAASAILRDARSLPLSQGGACPADSGAMYKMIFVQQGVVVTANPTGCQVMKISGLSGVYRADARFCQDAHQANGKPIFPGSSARYY